MLKRDIILAGTLVSAILVAAISARAKTANSSKTAKIRGIKSSRTIEVSAKLERQMEIYEHAAANRELAALTQMEHAQKLKEKAAEAIKTRSDTDISTYKSAYSKAGSLEKSAAGLYGQAAANFDKASANRAKVASVGKKLGKVEVVRNSEIYATKLKAQGSEAIQMAADACEAAAVAYDKAENLTEVAANSQRAATWLEKLALR